MNIEEKNSTTKIEPISKHENMTTKINKIQKLSTTKFSKKTSIAPSTHI